MTKLKVSAATPTFTRTYIFMVLCLIKHYLNFRSLQSANHPFPVAQTGQRSVFITACSFWSDDQRRSCSAFRFEVYRLLSLGLSTRGGGVTVLVLSDLQDKYQGT